MVMEAAVVIDLERSESSSSDSENVCDLTHFQDEPISDEEVVGKLV